MAARTGAPVTLPAIFVTTLLEVATGRGAIRARLVRDAGLDEAMLARPEAPLAIERVFAAWAAAMRALRDDGLPVTVARTFALEHYPILGFAAMTAPSVREALARVVRFSRIVTTSGRWTLVERGAEARLAWTREGARDLGHRVANESVLAEMLHGLRQTLGHEVAAHGVSLRHPGPPDQRAHERHFGCRPRWEQPADELILPRALLDAAPRHANPALAAHFEREALAALRVAEAALGRDDTLVERTRRIVGEALLGGEPSSAHAARCLGLSERSLRRALAGEGSSFRAIVEAVRQERAEALLGDPRRSVAEVALSLGFSELSAFSRAYKRWTGRAPSTLRTSSPG